MPSIGSHPALSRRHMLSDSSKATVSTPGIDETTVPELMDQPPHYKRTNTLLRIRNAIRAPMAEFLAMAVFVIFGAGADAQAALSTNPKVSPSPKGEYISTNFGWGIGLAMAVWICGGISGGHVNPAITLALAARRGFPWKRVPIYILAQTMGGVVGAGLVYSQYIHAIDIFEGGRNSRTLATAGFFSSFALDYMTAVSCFFSEFLGTAVLAFVIMAATDKNNNAAPPRGLLPLVLFLTLLGLGASLGMQTAFSFNPARDFGPRLFLSMVGYGRQVYTYRNQYWLWCPILASILGAQVAAAVYDIFLYNTGEIVDAQQLDIIATPNESSLATKFNTSTDRGQV